MIYVRLHRAPLLKDIVVSYIMNNELTMLAKFIAKKIESNGYVNDNTPHAVAAGIIFFIGQECNIDITKKSVKQVSGVSEVTINKCYKKNGFSSKTI